MSDLIFKEHKIHKDLKEKGLTPSIHLVDAGYPENEWVLKSQKEGIRVVGPARVNHHWQAKEGKGFALKVRITAKMNGHYG